MEKKNKSWLLAIPATALMAFIVAGIMIVNQNNVSSEMKGLYNFATEEQLYEQMSNPDSEFLKNNTVCVNGIVYRFGDSGKWESTGQAVEGTYIQNGIDGKNGVSSYQKCRSWDLRVPRKITTV